jgi:hypothetical protein
VLIKPEADCRDLLRFQRLLHTIQATSFHGLMRAADSNKPHRKACWPPLTSRVRRFQKAGASGHAIRKFY